MADETQAGGSIEPPITINIGNIVDGAVIEAFGVELQKVVNDIMDPSTEARQKRRITLEVEFHPKDDRIQVAVQFTCKAKLAGLIPSTSRLFIGRTEGGQLVPLAEDPRQMNIFTPPKPVQLPAPIVFSGKK